MLIGSHTKALREATSAIDLGVMTEVSRRVALSSHVDIYGVVGSAMLAEELQGRLYRIGVPAYAWSEVHSGLTSAAIRTRTLWRSAFRPLGELKRRSRCWPWPVVQARSRWLSPMTPPRG